jgi:uncharacterized protein (TIGR03118 family)
MKLRVLLSAAAVVLLPLPVEAAGYQIVNLVANKQIYAPQIVDKEMVNAWGLAIRPAGKGGHFWVNNTDTGTVSLYVGDVGGAKLYQDETKLVKIAATKGQKDPSTPTGQVFNGVDTDFIVTHAKENLTGPSKFIFCTEDGTISGWTERKNEDGSWLRPAESVLMVDNSKKGAIYKGLAISAKEKENRLYAADFGNGRIDAFDAAFKPARLGKEAFQVPGGQLPKGYAPFNVQAIDGTLYVVYARLTKEKGEEEKGNGFGHVAQFDADGKFIRMLEGAGKLNAPWGVTKAPEDFGEASGKLLVGNFGDGRIVMFDAASGKQEGYLQNAAGEPVEIDGLWGMLFGNGEHLGERNNMYFAAGPQDEKDGVFGKLVPVK